MKFDADYSPEPEMKFDADRSPEPEMKFDADRSPEPEMKFDADRSPEPEPSPKTEMQQKFDADGSPDSNKIIDPPLKQDITSMQSDSDASPKDKLKKDSKSDSLSDSDMSQTNLECSDATFGSSKKHLKLRQEADKRYRQNAERMKMKYCKAKHKKVATFDSGDFVSIKIPRIDRTSTDIHRLPCVVVQQLGSQYHLYRLRYMLNL